ncbi:ketopantoate reductase family protein [Sphingomonas sp.]|uniref:ketopantoate reductase family protein n=1 Tax=Sphingomonas sp. TaxID=28214 RepID=UPI000DAFD856|nr:2-dehydropantoate 2-reductase [Sphingomonas sp.]PZU10758.1 MAG: hypothetical protein DI605_03690 [Sphingomonas sp.]
MDVRSRAADTPPRIVVIGAGAIGTAIAGRLAADGQDVRIVARGARRQALEAHGVILREGGGVTRARPPVSAPDQPSPHDIVILAVKSHQLAESAASLAAFAAPGALVLPLVNGVPWWFFSEQARSDLRFVLNSGDVIGDALRDTVIVGAVVYTSATLVEGIADVVGRQHIVLGMTGPGFVPDHLRRLLDRAGIRTQISPDIRGAAWSKLMLNAASNPVSVLAQASLGQIASDPDLFAVMMEVLEEMAALGAKLGHASPFDRDAVKGLMQARGDFQTSMLQDYRAGRPLELGTLCEVPLAIADVVGHPMPALRCITRLARFHDQGM